jgi:hypothetical protein
MVVIINKYSGPQIDNTRLNDRWLNKIRHPQIRHQTSVTGFHLQTYFPGLYRRLYILF